MVGNGDPPSLALEWEGADEPSSSSTSLVPAYSAQRPAVQQEAYSASHYQPCSFCQHNSSHAYFESMEPDTDTDSDLTDFDEDEEYIR
eukprot:12895014-Prorocentrum_lima.AAC.1